MRAATRMTVSRTGEITTQHACTVHATDNHPTTDTAHTNLEVPVWVEAEHSLNILTKLVDTVDPHDRDHLQHSQNQHRDARTLIYIINKNKHLNISEIFKDKLNPYVET